VEAGGEVIIARDDTPVAKLVAIAPKPKRVFGAYRGEGLITDAFFEPLPEDELAAWESEHATDPISVDERTRRLKPVKKRKSR
jgi:antitoxin (DNA-binding transcriptional repressor) of toxin-antitoxin stability system